ncbi:axoneme-associated protein mst101(2)-like [Mastacembelus armatus]|uniref:axoneme-associated protein mst101(2)-like n=1 Tax=Mastacembelus armatus TaxID=205130 RepID=UPI000E465761|nr:axoneme-associated protein mst101(2)-like [Mastacembelus armatus]
MASEQDPALLSLIYQHLRVSGFSTAAQLLEEHVAQVPNERFNLRDVYTGWMKVCSLVQDAKQVTGESTASKIKSFSPGPAAGDEEDCDGTELSNVTGDEVSSLESKADDVESSCVGKKCSCTCEQQLDTAGETDSCDGGQEEQESAPTEVSAEATNGAESGSSDSSDSEDVIEITQEDCILLSPRQTTSNQAEARPQTPEPPETCGSDSERNEENWKDDGEPKQEPEGAMDASNVREEASEPEHTPPSTVQADDEGSSAKETVVDLPSLAEPASSHLAAQQTNEQLAESEAPPPADPDPENPEEGRDEPEENPKGCGLTSPLNPKDQVDALTTTDPADPPLTDTEKATVVQAEEQEDPDDCIILNDEVENSKAAEGESSKLCPESCKNSESPTKQTSEKDTHTPTTDPVSDTPLTSECARKKKKGRKMQRKVAEEEDKPQAASSEKKNAAKKRKRKMEGKDEEMLTESPKEVKGVEEESEAAEVVMESPVDTTKGTKKMKKKRKGGGRQEKKKQQSHESPAGGNKDTDKSLDTTDGDSSQLSSAKKKQRYKKRRFSLKKRLRLYRKNESKSSSFLAGDTTSTDHVETPRSKPTKRPQPDPPQEEVTPKKKKKMNTNTEENSSKENQPPQKKNKQKSSAEEESGVVSDMSIDFPAEKKRKAGKGKKFTRTSTPVTASHDTPATKNKNRRKKKLEETEAAADATPPCSCSCDTTPPHTHLGSSPIKKINFD